MQGLSILKIYSYAKIKGKKLINKLVPWRWNDSGAWNKKNQDRLKFSLLYSFVMHM